MTLLFVMGPLANYGTMYTIRSLIAFYRTEIYRRINFCCMCCTSSAVYKPVAVIDNDFVPCLNFFKENSKRTNLKHDYEYSQCIKQKRAPGFFFIATSANK